MSAMPNNHWDIAGINWTSSVLAQNTLQSGWLGGLIGSFTPSDGIEAPVLTKPKPEISVSFSRAAFNIVDAGSVRQPGPRNADNALFAFAAGNGPLANPPDPNYLTSVNTWAPLASSNPNVISVGALEHTKTTVSNLENASGLNIAPYSNRGSNLTLVAPTDTPATDSPATCRYSTAPPPPRRPRRHRLARLEPRYQPHRRRRA